MSIIDRVLNIFKTTHRQSMSPSAGEMIDKDGKIFDFTEYLKALIDPLVFAPKVIDISHHEIHEGNSFYLTDVSVLDTAGVQNYLLEIPDSDVRIHFGYETITNGIFTIELFEATDKFGSVEETFLNRDRNSLTTSLAKFYKGITGGTTDGVRILHWAGGAVQGNSRTAVGSGGGLERILKKGTKYILRITSGSTATTFSTRFDFYQE